MAQYFWAANGNLIKKKVIEQMSTNMSNFNIKDDKICLDETCLSKNEISQF